MKWYKSLDIHQRINLKELSREICGVDYKFMIFLFGFIETMNMLHRKLKDEGFNI